MSSFRSRSSRSSWNRPKPKIYESNFREQERQYKDPYKDYSDTKSYIREHKTQWDERSAEVHKELDNIYKYGTRRAGSMTPRKIFTPDNPISLQRANSINAVNEANAEGTYVRSRLEASKDYLGELYSKRAECNEEGRTSLTTRASSLPKAQTAYEASQDEEMENINRRLEKLRKLREELGLPSEANSDPAPEPYSARGRELKANMTSSSARSSSRSRALDSSDDFSSTKKSTSSSLDDYSSTKKSSTARVSSARSSVTRDEPEDYKPTRRSARAAAAAAASSSMTNGRSSSTRDEYESKYSVESSTPRSSKIKFSDDSESDYKTKSSIKSSMKSSTTSSSKLISNVDDYDDDMLLPDLRKKLPSSQEILDRIKEMDL